MLFKNADTLAKEATANLKKQEKIKALNQCVQELRDMDLAHHETISQLRHQFLENIERVRLEDEQSMHRINQIIQRLQFVKKYLAINATSGKAELQVLTEVLDHIKPTDFAQALGLTSGLVLSLCVMGAGLYGAVKLAMLLHVLLIVGALGGPVGLIFEALVFALILSSVCILYGAYLISQQPTKNVQALNDTIEELKEAVVESLNNTQKEQLSDMIYTPVVQKQASDAMCLIANKIVELAEDTDTLFSRTAADDKIATFKVLSKILADDKSSYLDIRQGFNDWKNGQCELPNGYGKKPVADILAVQRREGFFAYFNPKKTDSEQLCETVRQAIGA